jgi:hypothetical protein
MSYEYYVPKTSQGVPHSQKIRSRKEYLEKLGTCGAGEEGAAEDSVIGAGEDGAAEDSDVEEAGGVLEEMTMVGVKLSDSLVVAPELLAEAELGATDVGANGIEVVVVVHSDVVAVAVAVVVVYYFKSLELAWRR